jgi:glyoxylase-like metal-dependent hydrolase (beta-lactamase superfamily II)
MGLTIEIINCGDVHIESSFLVERRDYGLPATVRTNSYLILGGREGPMLVDTGYRSLEVMEAIGFKGTIHPGAGFESELARLGLRPGDIRYIFHTHLHVDHAGKDDIFPNSTTVVLNRRELEIGCGSGGFAYPAIDMKHLVDRVHTKGAAKMMDLQDSGPVEIMEGLALQWAGGHTAGSMNILVETDDGTACICGDLVYHVQDQIITPNGQINQFEPAITGNTTMTKVEEKGAIKKALNSCTWLLPAHDQPARIAKGGIVVGRLEGAVVPGPVIPLASNV